MLGFSRLCSLKAGMPIRMAQRQVLSHIRRIRQGLALHARDQDLQIADGIREIRRQLWVVTFDGAVLGAPSLKHVLEASNPVVG